MWNEAGRAAWSFVFSTLPLWVGLVIFGVAWLVRDYVGLRRFVSREKVQADEFRKWLRDHPEYVFPAMATRSLDERIIAVLEWWQRARRAADPTSHR